MQRPINATADDYRSWIDFVLERQSTATLKQAMEMRTKFARMGQSSGSGVQLFVAEIARGGLDEGIDLAFGQLKRVSEISAIDKRVLREVTEQCLRSFLEHLQTRLMPSPSGLPGSSDILKKQLPALNGHLDRALHWFDAGLLVLTEPKVPISMTNNLHIGSMAGGAIQQGSAGAAQNVQIVFGDIATPLGELEKLIGESKAGEDARAVLTADIATIKAQLTKPIPSSTILAEAGSSIRSVVENLVASALISDTAIKAAIALGLAIGLG